MRNALVALGTATCPDHVGLAYDMWAPVKPDDPKAGKVPDGDQDAWFTRLEAIGVSPDYQHSFGRWRTGLEADNAKWMEITLSSRLLVGHGNPAPTEVGLTVHHTWGVPVIPGSALKGLLNHYVQTTYGPDAAGKAPYDDEHTDKTRRDFQGVTWNQENKRILHGSGATHRALFGSPSAESDERMQRELSRSNPALADLVGASQGLVQFHDAWYVPGSITGDRPFAKDILTVHQGEYYKSSGANWPNDYDSPNPVAFLTVRPQARFFVALTGPAAWTELAAGLLEAALAEWGIGGKTAAGYGRMKVTSRSQSEAEKVSNLCSGPLFRDLDATKSNDLIGRIGGLVGRVESEMPDAQSRRCWATNALSRLRSEKLDKGRKDKSWFLMLQEWAEGATSPVKP